MDRRGCPGRSQRHLGHDVKTRTCGSGRLWRSEDVSASGDRIEFVDPVAYDAWCADNGGSPLLTAPANAAEIAEQLIADPNFETTAPVAALIGGVEAVSIDVTLAPGGKACGIGMIDIPRWIHTIGWDPGLRLRLYLVDLPEGMSVRDAGDHRRGARGALRRRHRRDRTDHRVDRVPPRLMAHERDR